MEIVYIKALVFLGLIIGLPAIYIMKHEGVFGFKKTPIVKIPKDGQCIDFFDELLEHMSGVVGSKLDYASRSCVRGLIFKNLSHSKPYNGKQLACSSVQIRFMLKVYPKGIRRIVAYAESSYGEPSWDGREMHYNYPIENDNFEVDINDFQTLWDKLVDKFYVIDVAVDETTERVREGSMSYWTEKQYGHLL